MANHQREGCKKLGKSSKMPFKVCRIMAADRQLANFHAPFKGRILSLR